MVRFGFPKFIWVAEISTYASYVENKVYGEIVIDATSSRMSHIDRSLIMIRYLDHIGYKIAGGRKKAGHGPVNEEHKGFQFPNANV